MIRPNLPDATFKTSPKPTAAAGRGADVEGYWRHYIRVHRLRPGDQLPGELEVSRALGVSRPVVREASKALAAIGLINGAPGRYPTVGALGGGVVRQVLEDAVLTGQTGAREILELRRGLEIDMASLAARGRGPGMADRLLDLVGRMEASLDEAAAYVGWDMAFHMALADATGNRLFAALMEGCRAAFEASMAAGLQHRFGRPALERVQRLHVLIAHAVIDGDGPAAAAAMTSHFDDALAALYRPDKA